MHETSARRAIAHAQMQGFGKRLEQYVLTGGWSMAGCCRKAGTDSMHACRLAGMREVSVVADGKLLFTPDRQAGRQTCRGGQVWLWPPPWQWGPSTTHMYLRCMQVWAVKGRRALKEGRSVASSPQKS